MTDPTPKPDMNALMREALHGTPEGQKKQRQRQQAVARRLGFVPDTDDDKQGGNDDQ